ncbi:hypothetical protein GCM10022233_44650 [Streptomyces shaanxiensis]|uniref:Uncharacterized protein n=1 Tax=Streptomyces shaanxiensis TaxID=653357 RepID=A0ABP7VDY4_9ACTN
MLESAAAVPPPVATRATELKRTASAVAAGRVRLRTVVSNPPERKVRGGRGREGTRTAVSDRRLDHGADSRVKGVRERQV